MGKVSQNSKYRLFDGLARQNIVLMSGIAIAPVAAGATDYKNALALSVGFSLITLFSVPLCRFIPKSIVYTIRVIIYALIAGLAFIPAYMAVDMLYGKEVLASIGVYFPILAVNPLILAKTETRFTSRPLHLMMLELAGYIIGFNIVCIAVGITRDILVNGRVGGVELSAGFEVPALSTTFGGLLLVGVLAGGFRWLYNRSKQRRMLREREERRRLELIRQID